MVTKPVLFVLSLLLGVSHTNNAQLLVSGIVQILNYMIFVFRAFTSVIRFSIDCL